MNAEALEMMLQRELPAAAHGDHGAYGRIVLACQNTVTAIALAITRDVAASEDIAQEAFLKAWQQLDRLKNSTSFLPWLRQITRNLARDYLRAHRNQPLDGPNAELVMAMAADPGPQPMQAPQPGLMPTVPGFICGQLCMAYTDCTGKRSNSPSSIIALAPAKPSSPGWKIITAVPLKCRVSAK